MIEVILEREGRKEKKRRRKRNKLVEEQQCVERGVDEGEGREWEGGGEIRVPNFQYCITPMQLIALK